MAAAYLLPWSGKTKSDSSRDARLAVRERELIVAAGALVVAELCEVTGAFIVIVEQAARPSADSTTTGIEIHLDSVIVVPVC
jgi:hypothetical protein